jgi:hypothetical protein
VSNIKIASAHSTPSSKIHRAHRVQRLCVTMLFLMVLIPTSSGAQSTSQAKAPEPVPEPAIAAILSIFDRYEVVAMPQGRGMQDLNDFIFSLIRTPAFSERVND